MKKVADLYIRVSTDEQADRGYSQRNQEEVLRKYCEINFISVRDVIYEDHSAKTVYDEVDRRLFERSKDDIYYFISKFFTASTVEICKEYCEYDSVFFNYTYRTNDYKSIEYKFYLNFDQLKSIMNDLNKKDLFKILYVSKR